MTGMYMRVKRGGKFCSIEVEYLTPEELDAAFSRRETDELVRWIVSLCDSIRQYEDFLREMEKDGLVTRKEIL